MKIATTKAAPLMAIATALTLLACGAHAHPGHIVDHGTANMFALGFWHPLTGTDHLLVMLAVGMWSALTHRTLREAIALPIVFATLLLAGAAMGLAGMMLPAIEPMIMASLLVLGLLVASRYAMPGRAGFALVGGFALVHGLAHGMELPQTGGAMGFAAGFMATTLALHVIGLYLGFRVKDQGRWVTGILGTGVATYGALLFTGI